MHLLFLILRSTPLFSIIEAAGWPIWPLIVCSVISLAIVIERFYQLQTSKIAPPQLLEEVLSISKNSIPSLAVVSQLEKNSALGEVLASAMRAVHTNPHSTDAELQAIMENTGRVVAHRMEKYLNALGTIASATPLMGLLGTVIGMIEIFAAQSAGSGGSANPTQLAHGISIALYNTAFALMVAIPALIFWRYFRARVDAYLLTLELAATKLARHIQSMRQG
jgi:biopolymer transport protein ExbB